MYRGSDCNEDCLQLGVRLGAKVADCILVSRVNDSSSKNYPWGLAPLPGTWQPEAGYTPLGPGWGLVEPFAILGANEFRPECPPALSSPEYAAAYNMVKAYGGGNGTKTLRTREQTIAGIRWSYDSEPYVGTPVKSVKKRERERERRVIE